MSDIKWIKLSVDMFDDEKIKLLEKMPEGSQMLIIWIRLLALAGKTNDQGRIYLNEHVPYNEDMLATLFNKDVGIVRVTLQTLQKFGMIQISGVGIIEIENWEKHQNVIGMERVRELTRKRVEKHRRSKQQSQIEQPKKDSNVTSNVTVTHGNGTDIDKELDIDKDINNNIDFQSFWESNGFGPMLPRQLENIQMWVDDFNSNQEIVLKALEVASEQGPEKRNYAYVNRILQNWEKRGFQNVHDVEVAEARRQAENEAKQNKPTYQRGGRKEVLPDWLDKQPEEITTKPADPNLNQQVEEIKRKLREERDHVSSGKQT
ncbi:TPA_asm: DnaD domain protein [Listeria monocytogenes]|nr:DnaD domain protein [Listeria monocytogenes]HAB7751307.1 DnaD domain protein [Listeria monocytogenes]HAB7758111.1 DnaD domain protein [Listeria monocytogenes]HAB7762073.1 DnaD domain protein [Listeria monocytogenes]HAB7775775.1 DnaD domain protein [Listeria monocytogenes]